MVELSFEQCFNTIGIQNGDTFDIARKAYKKQLHRLHPDRYPNDPVAQAKASKKFQQVTRCFQLIEEHFLIYGEMPFVDPECPDTTDHHDATSDNSTHSQSKKRDELEVELLRKASILKTDSEGYYESKPSSPHGKNKEKAASAGELGAGLFIITILAYFLLNPPTEKFWDTSQEQQTADQSQAEQDKSIQTNKNLHSNLSRSISFSETNPTIDETTSSSTPDRFSEEALKAKALLSKKQQRIMETQNGKSFTFGSSFKEVVAIHGAPDISNKDTWYYDKSKVIFKNGRVIDWKSDPSYPLATRLK